MAGGWGAQPGVFTPLLQSEDGSSVHHLSAWPLTSIPCVNRQNKQNEGRGRGKGDKGARYAPPLPASRTGKTLMQRPRRRRQGCRGGGVCSTRVCVCGCRVQLSHHLYPKHEAPLLRRVGGGGGGGDECLAARVLREDVHGWMNHLSSAAQKRPSASLRERAGNTHVGSGYVNKLPA